MLKLHMPLDAVQRETLSCAGWVYLAPQSGRETDALIRSLGPSIPSGPPDSAYHDLRPYAADEAPRRSMSSFVGMGQQPMHTDRAHTPIPPRYVLLLCLDPGEHPCPTQLWKPDMEQLAGEQSSMMQRAHWVFYGGQTPAFYGCILECSQTLHRLRFDPYCMRAASFCRYRVEHAQDLLSASSRKATVQWETGGLLIVDNWRCLHARSSGADKAPSRRLRRWYIGNEHGME